MVKNGDKKIVFDSNESVIKRLYVNISEHLTYIRELSNIHKRMYQRLQLTKPTARLFPASADSVDQPQP